MNTYPYMGVLFSFIPVILFLGFLFLLDHFRLVRLKILAICLVWGLLSALAASWLNTAIAGWLNLDFNLLSRYAAPVIEETLKALVIILLVKRKKIGFTVDAAIYGFAVGAGFSLMENIFYLLSLTADTSPVTWIIRGFGTAIMHGGATALLAVFLLTGVNLKGGVSLPLLAGWLLAILLHSGFNHFPLSPLIQTIGVMVLFPLIFILIFKISHARMRQWLEIEFSSEVELLSMIRKGRLSETRAGTYLLSIRERFDPETVVDLYCYLALYLELSIKAKRNLMLKENDFPILPEPDMAGKLLEIKLLRKNIGALGEMALSPLVRLNHRSLWKLSQLESDV